MRQFGYLLLFLILALGLFSCASLNSDYLTVASKKGDCVGVAPQKCLLIKENESADWTYFYQDIQDFNYEEGYEYILKVRKEKVENSPADASFFKYILVKEVSKINKTSVNLP